MIVVEDDPNPPMSTQVLLRKGDTEQTTWIPSEYAEVGRVLKLRKRTSYKVLDGPFSRRSGDPEDWDYTEWDDGWEVKEVYSELTSEEVHTRSQEHKFWKDGERQPRLESPFVLWSV